MNNSTINEQTWEINRSISYQVLEQQKAQKRGEARVAEYHHVRGKQKIAKDIVLPSAGDAKEEITKGKRKANGKPKLPVPSSKFSGLRADDGDNEGQTMGLIAIIGEVMALQAKTNSNFWSTLWKQASQSMMIQVKFAPIIAEAIRTQYNAQSKATKAQANEAYYGGIVDLLGFGGAMLFAGVGEFFGSNDAEAENGVDNAKDGGYNIEDENADSDTFGINSTEGEGIQNEINVDSNEIDNDINNSTKSKRPSRYWKAFQDAGKKMKRFNTFFGKGMQYAMGFDMASRGAKGVFITKKYANIRAKEEGIQGQAQALSQEAQTYQELYKQIYTRDEEIRAGCQQNIDYMMNILKSAADTITSTVQSMFRG